MSDVLEHVYEYRKLLARRDMLVRRLDAASSERLEALERLFAAATVDELVDNRRRHARCEVSYRATVKARGRVQQVDIINVGGGGMCVAPAPELRPGERAVVRIYSRTTGREYHYPVQALWVHRTEGVSAMGLPFVGAPLQVARPT